MVTPMDMGNSTMDHGGMDHGDTDHGDMDHGDMDHSMMHMWFYFGITNITVLFKSWTINNAGEMVGSCIGVFLLAALYEGLKVLREILLHRSFVQRRRQSNHTDYQNGVALMDSASIASLRRSSVLSWSHFLQTFLHLVQVSISYALMLIFMTYNGYLAISILVGACVGYFAFGWKKAVIVDVNEHCH